MIYSQPGSSDLQAAHSLLVMICENNFEGEGMRCCLRNHQIKGKRAHNCSMGNERNWKRIYPYVPDSQKWYQEICIFRLARFCKFSLTTMYNYYFGCVSCLVYLGGLTSIMKNSYMVCHRRSSPVRHLSSRMIFSVFRKREKLHLFCQAVNG